MFQVVDSYPADAVGGADFFSLAAARRLLDTRPDGTEFTRPERILVTDREWTIDDRVDGRICISEQTIRTMGALVGLVDGVTADRIERANRRLTAENDQLSAEVVELRQALATAQGARVIVYVSADGTEHATGEAARRHDTPTPTVMAPSAPLPEAP